MHFKYDQEKYPQKPVFTKKIDKVSREYFTAYSNKQGFACISIGEEDGNNYIYEGNPKINYRKGDSKFGAEIIFELLVKGLKEKTPKRTKYESIEIYMPYEKGIEFLESAIKYFKGQDK